MPDQNEQRTSDFKQLRWSLHALATAGSSQRALFPDHVRKADELALDFDHRASVVRDQYQADLSDTQSAALATLAEKLALIARDGAEFDADLWTDDAVRSSEQWADIRRLATAALEAFGWAVERPSASRF